MPVELRKRKAPAAPIAPAPPAKKSRAPAKAKESKPAAPKPKAVSKSKAASAAKDTKKSATAATATVTVTATTATTTNGSSAAPPKKAGKIAVGESVSLDNFGGEIETHDGEKTTLSALVEASTSGVILFTYPKASTPGCTKQACLFRDAYKSLTSTGLSIYGLSTDSPKSNTAFKTKQNLPYPLLCDPSATLIGAIGLKKSPKGAVRGVFGVDKDGKILASELGGPEATVEVVKKLVGADDTNGVATDNEAPADKEEEKNDEEEETAEASADAPNTTEKPEGEKETAGEGKA